MSDWNLIFVNYELWRGNPLLAGNLQWDLVLDNPGSGLSLKEFHLSPVNSIYFSVSSSDELLNYTHQYNLKAFYEKVQGEFYSPSISPEFKTLWPSISDTVYDNRNTDFDYGLKRDTYSKYGKEFKFFLPIWFEQITDIVKIKLDLVSSYGNTISSKIFELNTENPQTDVHKKFTTYFNDWISYLGIDSEGCTNNIFISLDTLQGAIHGVEVTSGNIQTKDISTIVTNICNRERPVLEVDSMIAQSYADKLLISKNLFHFCLHFNLEDILGSVLAKRFIGVKIRIKATVYIGSEQLEMKTFWSNYEYIPKDLTYNNTDSELIRLDVSATLTEDEDITTTLSDTSTYTLLEAISDKEISVTISSGNDYEVNYSNEVITGDDLDTVYNVLEYLKDNKAFELVPKNKFTQNIFHWALRNSPTTIFNVYEGFAGKYIYTSTQNAYSMNHGYSITPNLNSTSWSENLNNDIWCFRIGKKEDGCTCSSLKEWYINVYTNGEKMYTDYSEDNTINGIIFSSTFDLICAQYKSTVSEFNTEFTIYSNSNCTSEIESLSISSPEEVFYIQISSSDIIAFNILIQTDDYLIYYALLTYIDEKPVFLFLKLTSVYTIGYITIYEIYQALLPIQKLYIETEDEFSVYYYNTTYTSGDTINITIDSDGNDIYTSLSPVLDVTSGKYWYIDSEIIPSESIVILLSMITSIIFTYPITYTNTLIDYRVNSPSNKTSEIEWYKYDSTGILSYVWRNSGLIRPYFISVPTLEEVESYEDSDDEYFYDYEKIPGNRINRLYYKDIASHDWLNNVSNKYSIIAKKGFVAQFPSIGYCGIKYLYEMEDSLVEEYDCIDPDEKITYTWNISTEWKDCTYKNIGHIFLLPTVIEKEYNGHTQDTLENIALETLQKTVSNIYDENDFYTYILSLYTYEINWEYASLTNINLYNYTIKMTLK